MCANVQLAEGLNSSGRKHNRRWNRGHRLFHDSLQSSHVPMSSWPKDRSASASAAGRARFAGGFRPLLSTSPTSASCLQTQCWQGRLGTQIESGRTDAYLRCAAAGFRPLLRASLTSASCGRGGHTRLHTAWRLGSTALAWTAALQHSGRLSACLQHTPAPAKCIAVVPPAAPQLAAATCAFVRYAFDPDTSSSRHQVKTLKTRKRKLTSGSPHPRSLASSACRRRRRPQTRRVSASRPQPWRPPGRWWRGTSSPLLHAQWPKPRPLQHSWSLPWVLRRGGDVPEVRSPPLPDFGCQFPESTSDNGRVCRRTCLFGALLRMPRLPQGCDLRRQPLLQLLPWRSVCALQRRRRRWLQLQTLEKVLLKATGTQAAPRLSSPAAAAAPPTERRLHSEDEC